MAYHNPQLIKILAVIVKKPGNNQCADCNMPSQCTHPAALSEPTRLSETVCTDAASRAPIACLCF